MWAPRVRQCREYSPRGWVCREFRSRSNLTTSLDFVEHGFPRDRDADNRCARAFYRANEQGFKKILRLLPCRNFLPRNPNIYPEGLVNRLLWRGNDAGVERFPSSMVLRTKARSGGAPSGPIRAPNSTRSLAP